MFVIVVYTGRLPLSVSLRLSLTHPFSPTSASIASLGSLSFDYCFVKCDVKDSKITPIRVASIVLAIKPVLAHSLFSVISLSPSRRLICRRIAIPSLPHSVFFLPLPPLSLSFVQVPSSRRDKCSLRKFKFIPGSRSLEERIKGPSVEPPGSTRRYLIPERPPARMRGGCVVVRSRTGSPANGALLFHFPRRISRELV